MQHEDAIRTPSRDVARRIHAAALGPAAPLVIFPASELLEDRAQFAKQWRLLIHAGRGGSILITDIEQMPGAAQTLLAESLQQPDPTASALPARLMTGTAVSLIDRVRSGQLSEDLLYRVNLIHLYRGEGWAPGVLRYDSAERRAGCARHAF